MRKPLTPKQREIYDFICAYIDEFNKPPYYKDISTAFGLSVKRVYEHINALVEKEYIWREPQKAMTLRVVRFYAIELTDDRQIDIYHFFIEDVKVADTLIVQYPAMYNDDDSVLIIDENRLRRIDVYSNVADNNIVRGKVVGFYTNLRQEV